MDDSVDAVNDVSLDTANISNLNTKKSRRGRPPKPPVASDDSSEEDMAKIKLCKAEIYRAVTASIHRSVLQTLPGFDEQIKLVEIERGQLVPIIADEYDSCQRITLKEVSRFIMKYSKKLVGIPGYQLTARDCRDCAEYWEYSTDSIKNLAHVKFSNEPGLCWNRLPFELKAGPTPYFDEMFSRMSNSMAVKAWIGSLFIPESYRQQYVYLHGSANDGKSSLMEFLARIFGTEGAFAQSTSPRGEHWAERYPGKRFIYFPDFKDFSSLDNGPLKQITGGDRIYINPKHQTAYMSELVCKLMFGSNNMPSIGLQKSTLRRLIFAEMKSIEKQDTSYPEYLWNEGGAFLHKCIEAYHNLCPQHQAIKVSDESIEALEAWGARTEDQYELWFSNSFKVVTGALLDPLHVRQKIESGFHDYKTQMGCYEWLNKKGFKRVYIRTTGNTRRWTYKGLILKDVTPSWAPNIHLKS